MGSPSHGKRARAYLLREVGKFAMLKSRKHQSNGDELTVQARLLSAIYYSSDEKVCLQTTPFKCVQIFNLKIILRHF